MLHIVFVVDEIIPLPKAKLICEVGFCSVPCGLLKYHLCVDERLLGGKVIVMWG